MKKLNVLFLLLIAGCFGGLDNEPFVPGEGVVSGVVEGPIDTATAFVSVLGREELTSAIDRDGRFTIANVPSGSVELAASTGLGRATRRTVNVYNARAIEVNIATEPALAVSGRVVLEEMFRDQQPTIIHVEGLPITAATTAEGRYSLSSLPFGCHRLRAEHAGFESQIVETCGDAGEAIETNHHLRHEAPHQSAACAPCAEASECASGLCVDNGHERVCADACDAVTHCARGFTCSEVAPGVEACVLPGSSCAALSDFLHEDACTEDHQCGLEGVDDGICIPDHFCTIPCDDDHQCPAGKVCEIAERSFCR